MSDIDDGSDKPIGFTSPDGEFEVREIDGERCYHETDLGQHQRWMRQAPDLYEKYMTALAHRDALIQKYGSVSVVAGEASTDTAQERSAKEISQSAAPDAAAHDEKKRILSDGRYRENLEVALITLITVCEKAGGLPPQVYRAIDVAKHVLTNGYPPSVASASSPATVGEDQ